MKRRALVIPVVILAVAGLGGCVAVPVAGPPGAYVAPPPVVVAPYFYGGYGYYGRWGHGRYWR